MMAATTTTTTAAAAAASYELTPEQLQQYKENGYLIVPDFFSNAVCDELKIAAKKLVANMDPESTPKSVFSTTKQKTDQYFIESNDKIRFFWEPNVWGSDGKLCFSKKQALCKIGHALHALEPIFRAFSTHSRIQNVVKSLKLSSPAICQSMFIFKNAKIGGEVTPHVDSTFLYTNPTSITGFWFALEDCTTDNGCLWFIPGSHCNDKVERRYVVRNKITEGDDLGLTEFSGPPIQYDDSAFIPAEVKAGSLVLIHGNVVHKSLANTSAKSRNAYTFHVLEDDNNHEYSKENWLQRSESNLPIRYRKSISGGYIMWSVKKNMEDNRNLESPLESNLLLSTQRPTAKEACRNQWENQEDNKQQVSSDDGARYIEILPLSRKRQAEEDIQVNGQVQKRTRLFFNQNS